MTSATTTAQEFSKCKQYEMEIGMVRLTLALERGRISGKDSWIWVGFSSWWDGTSREGLPWKKAWRRALGILGVGIGYGIQFRVARAENVGERNWKLYRVRARIWRAGYQMRINSLILNLSTITKNWKFWRRKTQAEKVFYLKGKFYKGF